MTCRACINTPPLSKENALFHTECSKYLHVRASNLSHLKHNRTVYELRVDEQKETARLNQENVELVLQCHFFENRTFNRFSLDHDCVRTTIVAVDSSFKINTLILNGRIDIRCICFDDLDSTVVVRGRSLFPSHGQNPKNIRAWRGSKIYWNWERQHRGATKSEKTSAWRVWRGG